ncbi:L-threonylcarbamoyladenylate synthase [Ascidiimonas aurantiaca]|uniref:L-threonylcarbamoyladenylate synthase n=1 Tax=Ascidiimonas aurantiaca TaxID=1685432 RepID=UPI0030EE9FEC
MALITKDLKKAIAFLNTNELVAIPTETVYGLAANGTQVKAIQKIFQAKNRPANNPLILHFPDLPSMVPYTGPLHDDALKLANAFWPGPLTLLVPKTGKVPEIITAGNTRVAVRIPAHPLTRELLEKISYPLAAPSANPSGYISPTLPEHVEKQLGERIPLILDGGPCEKGIESTILGWDENQWPIIYRAGSITAEEIQKVLNKKPLIADARIKTLEAPGMLTSHYSPRTPTIVTNDVKGAIAHNAGKKIGIIYAMHKPGTKGIFKEIILSETGSLEEIARNLYKSMHEMDHSGIDILIIEKIPEEGVGKAINDRLNRASTLTYP